VSAPWAPPERLLTPGQAALLTRLSARTLARYADEGHLECVRTGRGWRMYPQSALAALFREETGEPWASS
jgi:excisionase family DNA binding protein